MRNAIGVHMGCGGVIRPISKSRAKCDRCGATEGEIDDSPIIAMIEAALGRKLGPIVAFGSSEDEQ